MSTEDHSMIVRRFFEAQEQLPPDMADVLHENLWNLYESDPPKVCAAQSVPERQVCLAGVQG